MDKYEIIKQLAEERKVEKLIAKITRNSSEELKDLSQDIYLNLLEKEDKKIVKLHETGELEYFIVGIITNNVFSKTSPYFTKYIKYNLNKEPLEYDESGEEREFNKHNGNFADL